MSRPNVGLHILSSRPRAEAKGKAKGKDKERERLEAFLTRIRRQSPRKEQPPRQGVAAIRMESFRLASTVAVGITPLLTASTSLRIINSSSRGLRRPVWLVTSSQASQALRPAPGAR